MKLFLFLFFLFPSITQALEVTASTDKKQLAVNEFFVFTIKIQSDEEKIEKLDIPDLSNLNDFHLLGQWSGRESSIQIINRRKENINIFLKSYRFQPKTTGTLRIESLKVRANGQIFQTQPIFLTITKEDKNIAPSSPPQSSPLALPRPFHLPKSLFDFFADPFQDENTTKHSIKLELNLSKNFFYKAEMIRADWLILQSSGSIHYEAYKNPSLKGFWKEELKNKVQNPFVGTQLIDKVLYRKSFLDSLWLFPLQTGELTIDSYSIRINHLFGFNSQEEIISSQSRKITVKDLPSQGLDEFFTGAVGSFEVESSIKEQLAVVNQPISYKITFEGLGHPRFISLPDLNFPSSVQIYPPVKNSHFSDAGKGRKEFEILIVPKKEGALEIPSFRLSTFDPVKGEYVFHQTSSFFLSVKRGLDNKESGQTFLEEKKQQEKPLSFEPLSLFYWPQFINHKNLTRFWLGFFSFVLFCLFRLYIKHFAFKKEKSLNQKIQQNFKAIEKNINKQDWKKACTQMIHLNYFVLYEIQAKNSSSDWRQALHNLPPSLNKKYAVQFETLFKKLEDLSFSPQTHLEKEAINNVRNLFKQTKTLINSFLSDL